jgi:2-amino-4-hydroxy-6-hydroxymethyldihydropteridine diphosphokinase
MARWGRIWVGAGGNLDGSREILRAAASAAAEFAFIDGVASVYRSAPMDLPFQPDFLNSALVLETDMEPRELLAELKAIERKLGRDPAGERYGPRLIDLDILVIEGICIDEPGLVVPHPRLAERRFALEPLAELNPELRPWAACDGDARRDLTVADALAAVMDQEVEMIAGPEWAASGSV